MKKSNTQKVLAFPEMYDDTAHTTRRGVASRWLVSSQALRSPIAEQRRGEGAFLADS